MSQPPISILISGAGVAGASLALMLAKHPSFQLQPQITIIERSPVPRTTGQAVDIRGPAVDVIRKLGLEPDIKARHTTETGTAFMNAKGQTIGSIDATGDAKRQSATSEYEILRGDLAGLLMDGIENVQETGSSVRLVYGERIASLDDRADGTGVDVAFANGKLEDQRFDVVVAADGIGSATRAMIFGKEDKREHVRPSGMYLGFFSIPRLSEDDGYWRWCTVAPGLAMHLRPHRSGKTMGVYLTMTNARKAPSPELDEILHADIATQKAYFRSRFQDAGWQCQRFVDGLDKTEDFYMTHWCQVVTPKWSKGRCVILGDAAFATMGVGTSLAMIGSYCLAGELSRIGSTDGVTAALHRYEDAYRPYTKKFETQMPGFPQIFNPQTTWGVWVLHTMIRVSVALRIPQTLMKWLDGEGNQTWKLPDSGW
ncbi:hypothetical protein ACN47E_001858 [Coniothyrium glycines]